MKLIGKKTLAGAALAWLAVSGTALACEEYTNFPAQELKEYRDKLVDAQADPLDRMFAFQQLVCSSNPVMRAYAVREGMRSSEDPIVRQQILFDSMMQKTRLNIEMTAGTDATKRDKEFIKKHSGLWSLPVRFRSQTDGCLGLFYERCDAGSVLYIRGDKATLTYDNVIGEFYLSDGGELVGFIRVSNNQDYGRIPSVIKLD